MFYILNVKFNFVYSILQFQNLNPNFIILYTKRNFSLSELENKEHLDSQWTNLEFYFPKTFYNAL